MKKNLGDKISNRFLLVSQRDNGNTVAQKIKSRSDKPYNREPHTIVAIVFDEFAISDQIYYYYYY